MKNKNYTLYLKSEYKRLKRNARVSCNDASNLRDMDLLLAKIDKMQSPYKENAFVEGIMRLNHIPSIAA